MLKETGKIVAIDKDALWVETIQRSVCGSCSAQKGCGQSLLNRLGAKPVYLRVVTGGRDTGRYRIGQEIKIGIPNDVVVKSSLLTYFLPIISSLVFASLAHTFYANEAATLLSALAGFIGGGVGVRFYASKHRNDSRYQPVLIDGSISNEEFNQSL